MGWSVPAPAWNRAGFFLLLLVLSHTLRAAGGGLFRWFVRLSLLPATYYWWTSRQAVENWGIKTFGPVQLKLSGVNAALSRLGVEPVELFVAREWRSLEPQFGWYLAGGGLFLTLLGAVLDRSDVDRCSDCEAMVEEGDRFCRQCGRALTSKRLCSSCASELCAEDRFCRRCGRDSSLKQESSEDDVS